MVSTHQHSEAGAARPGQRRGLLLLFLLVWTVFVLVALWWFWHPGAPNAGPSTWVLQDPAATHKAFAERARDWFRLVHVNFQRIYPWILFAPYIVVFALRFALERGRWSVSLPVHLAACAAFAAAAHAINARTSLTVADVVIVRSHQQTESSAGTREINAVEVKVSTDPLGEKWPGQMTQRLFRGELTNHPGPGERLEVRGGLPDPALTNLLSELEHAIKPTPPTGGPLSFRPLSTLLDLFAYAALAGLAHSFHFYSRYRERERRALSLESTLAKARLSALQAQLQPHFLFNTLNAIATLLRRDPRAAEATLFALSELLRLSLNQSQRQEIPLREELQFLDRYLEIQQTRFGDRLRIEQDIDPAALDCLVPTLLLQPLVENAIRHGLEPTDQGGLIRISARQREGSLSVSVEDNGVGLPAAAPRQPVSGIGLTNLQARLEALYGGAQKFELTPRPEGGVVVRIEIPCHAASAAVAESLLSAP